MNIPIAFAFCLLARNLLKKFLWGTSAFLSLVGIVLTYSRTGFLCLIICGVGCLYEFGIKGRRPQIIGLALGGTVIMLAVLPVIGLSFSDWGERMASIVRTDTEGSIDRGSKLARLELLDRSLTLMLEHPVFGVGPGSFPSLSGSWHVAHNSFTALGAEGGLPAMMLFIAFLYRALLNLRRSGQLTKGRDMQDLRILAQALSVSFAAYLVGALFADTQYELFPYFTVAYTTVLIQLARATVAGSDKATHRPPVYWVDSFSRGREAVQVEPSRAPLRHAHWR